MSLWSGLVVSRLAVVGGAPLGAGQVAACVRLLPASLATADPERAEGARLAHVSKVFGAVHHPATELAARNVLRALTWHRSPSKYGRLSRLARVWPVPDPQLRSSFCGLWSPAAFLVGLGLLGVWL